MVEKMAEIDEVLVRRLPLGERNRLPLSMNSWGVMLPLLKEDISLVKALGAHD
jgi:hypothetical protein